MLIFRFLLAIVKSMEEKNKSKRRKTRVENPVAGLVNDENSDEEYKRRVKLPAAVFTKRDDGEKNSDEQPTRKAVLMELFTKTGIAKVEVRASNVFELLTLPSPIAHHFLSSLPSFPIH